jgi:putative endonuclease
MKGGWVYMMSNGPNGTLYEGVTAEIVRRAYKHRTGAEAGFTKRYGLRRLVRFERHEEIVFAIQREKQIKNWRRNWKVWLIHEHNPKWDDLYPTLLG